MALWEEEADDRIIGFDCFTLPFCCGCGCGVMQGAYMCVKNKHACGGERAVMYG